MVVLITGASSGFGQLRARALRGRGHTVFSITYHVRGLLPERVSEFGFRLATGLDRS